MDNNPSSVVDPFGLIGVDFLGAEPGKYQPFGPIAAGEYIGPGREKEARLAIEHGLQEAMRLEIKASMDTHKDAVGETEESAGAAAASTNTLSSDGSETTAATDGTSDGGDNKGGLTKDAYNGYDASIDIETYNCAGLAFRNYKEMKPEDFKSFLETNNKNGPPEEGDVKFYLWEYDLSVVEVNGGVVYSPAYDFHIVAGLIRSNGKDPKSVYSKDGSRPVEGPEKPMSWVPPNQQNATYNNRYSTQAYDNFGRNLIRINANIRATTYVIPFSVLQTFKQP